MKEFTEQFDPDYGDDIADELGYIGPAPAFPYSPVPQIEQDTPMPADAYQYIRYRQEFEQARNFAPPQEAGVQSVFDTRPINATDFHISSDGMIVTCATTDVILSYVVPVGKIVVIRGLRWNLMWNDNSIPYAPATANIGTVTSNNVILDIDGVVPVDLVHNNVMAFQGINSDWNDIHVIVGPEQTINIRMGRNGTQLMCDGSTLYGHAELRGNIILSSGLPYKFEVGTRKLTGGLGPTDEYAEDDTVSYKTKFTYGQYVSLIKQTGQLDLERDRWAKRAGDRGPSPNPAAYTPNPQASFEGSKKLWDDFMNDPTAEFPHINAADWDAWGKNQQKKIEGLKGMIRGLRANALGKEAIKRKPGVGRLKARAPVKRDRWGNIIG